MAHFGVQKAKKMLALAGVTAIAGAGLVTAGNVSATASFSELTKGEDYTCGNADNKIIFVSTAKAVEFVLSDNDGLFDADHTGNCQDVFASGTTTNDIKYQLNGSVYNFSSLVKNSDVNNNTVYFYVNEGANVTFNGSRVDGLGQENEVDTFAIDVNNGATLNIKGGMYENAYIGNNGTLNISGADTFLQNPSIRNNTQGVANIKEASLSYTDYFNPLAEIINLGEMTFESGNLTHNQHYYSLNTYPSTIKNYGVLNIRGGDFVFDFENYSSTNDGSGERFGTDENPYYGEPGALINASAGTVNISNGVFSGKGTIVNFWNDSASVNVTGGNFESEHFASAVDRDNYDVNLSISNGVFNTRATFDLSKDQNLAVEEGKISESSLGVFRTPDGKVYAGVAAGPSSAGYMLIQSISTSGITGGDYSDGSNIDPADGYVKIDLDEDFDNDGKKNVRVVPGVESNLELSVGESKKPGGIPDGAENGNWSSSDTNVCTVSSDGTVTGVNAGNCQIVLILDNMYYVWNVTVNEKNPDTLDKGTVSAFTAAGAAIGGLTAVFATVRRFFGRK